MDLSIASIDCPEPLAMVLLNTNFLELRRNDIDHSRPIFLAVGMVPR